MHGVVRQLVVGDLSRRRGRTAGHDRPEVVTPVRENLDSGDEHDSCPRSPAGDDVSGSEGGRELVDIQGDFVRIVAECDDVLRGIGV